MIQAKFFPDLPAGERWSALLQTRLCEITVFEVFYVPLDEFAGVIGLRAPSAFRQFGKPPLDFRVKPDRKHNVVLPPYKLCMYDKLRANILSAALKPKI